MGMSLFSNCGKIIPILEEFNYILVVKLGLGFYVDSLIFSLFSFERKNFKMLIAALNFIFSKVT